MNYKRGFLALLSSAIIYSFFGLFVHILSASLGTFLQIAIRYGLIIIVLFFIILFTHISLRFKKINLLTLFIFLPSFPLAVIFFTISVLSIKAANTVFYSYVTSFLTALIIGKLFFKEKLTIISSLTILIALVGLIMFSYPFNISFSSFGVISGVLTGIFETIANTTRKLLGSYDKTVLVFYQYLTGFIMILILLTFLNEQVGLSITPLSIIVLLIFSLSNIIIGYLLLFGFNNFDLNLGSIILSSEVFFAMIINYFFLNQIPTRNELTGSILVFLAVVLINGSLCRVKEYALSN